MITRVNFDKKKQIRLSHEFKNLILYSVRWKKIFNYLKVLENVIIHLKKFTKKKHNDLLWKYILLWLNNEDYMNTNSCFLFYHISRVLLLKYFFRIFISFGMRNKYNLCCYFIYKAGFSGKMLKKMWCMNRMWIFEENKGKWCYLSTMRMENYCSINLFIYGWLIKWEEYIGMLLYHTYASSIKSFKCDHFVLLPVFIFFSRNNK